MATQRQRLRKQRRRAWARQVLHKSRARRSYEDPLPVQLIETPPSHEKMSEVLDEFVEPFNDMCQDEESLRRLYTMGMVAWNAAMLPEDRRGEMIDQLLANVPQDIKEDVRGMTELLVRRKLEHFAEIQRMIIDFHLEQRSTGPYLQVLSTM